LDSGTGGALDLFREPARFHIALHAQMAGDRQGLLGCRVLELPDVPQRAGAKFGECRPVQCGEFAAAVARGLRS
jgi:hypothetical protein